ncbi:hypothetical protein BDZ94DRAFT_724066 [Collybia nuda]|uniref:F-box domain-containing protein n=1 Tax=Collybia nuda TaxID=64659 RepID=A0A9P6CJ60_9AGAR|nr:hypothetical protein BDZ94DRAFT_724066 [Collybia nuda]
MSHKYLWRILTKPFSLGILRERIEGRIVYHPPIALQHCNSHSHASGSPPQSVLKIEPTFQSHGDLLSMLPAELVESIFSHCDANTLRASGLVCKYWRAITLRHLFTRVVISAAMTFIFVDFLRSDLGRPFREVVRSLSLTENDSSCTPIPESTVKSLSTLLQLSTLKLYIPASTLSRQTRSPYSRVHSPRDLSGFQRNFKAVTNLTLNIYSDTFIEVAELLNSFPTLETLTLSCIVRTDAEKGDSELPVKHVSLPRTLHSVHLPDVGSSAVFLRWLHSHKRKPLISTLTLGGIMTSRFIGPYIQELGKTLECLTMSGLISYQLSRGQLDLSYNTNLRKLTIRSQKSSGEMNFLALSKVGSYVLEEFAFDACDPTRDPGDEKFWPRLDFLLATPQFSKLRQIILTIARDEHHAVEARLPLTASRGILRFRVEPA